MNQKAYDWNLPKQDKLKNWGVPDKENHGNCWQYAIAALLQLPASEVPDFLGEAMEKCSDTDGLTQKWLHERGFFMLAMRGCDFWLSYFHGTQKPVIPWLACGPTPRSMKAGQHHVVVMVGDEMVYDPHPDNTGLTAITNSYLIFPIPRIDP